VARHLLLQEPRRSADAKVRIGLGCVLLVAASSLYLSGGLFFGLIGCVTGVAHVLLGLGDAAYTAVLIRIDPAANSRRGRTGPPRLRA
jgi:hypothetical protein